MVSLKKRLEKFLNIKKCKNEVKINDSLDESSQYVREKLDLISLVLQNYVASTKYNEYRDIINKINESVVTLKEIKDNLCYST